MTEQPDSEATLDETRVDSSPSPAPASGQEVRGGTVGLILDGRGRSLELPEERAACQSTVQGWLDSLDVYTEVAEPAAV